MSRSYFAYLDVVPAKDSAPETLSAPRRHSRRHIGSSFAQQCMEIRGQCLQLDFGDRTLTQRVLIAWLSLRLMAGQTIKLILFTFRKRLNNSGIALFALVDSGSLARARRAFRVIPNNTSAAFMPRRIDNDRLSVTADTAMFGGRCAPQRSGIFSRKTDRIQRNSLPLGISPLRLSVEFREYWSRQPAGSWGLLIQDWSWNTILWSQMSTIASSWWPTVLRHRGSRKTSSETSPGPGHPSVSSHLMFIDV
jgi:hypothetical protein